MTSLGHVVCVFFRIHSFFTVLTTFLDMAYTFPTSTACFDDDEGNKMGDEQNAETARLQCP